jgi:hypothetical protein
MTQKEHSARLGAYGMHFNDSGETQTLVERKF